MEGLLAVVLVLAIYFLPTVVAANRGRAVGVVLVINIFLGWTLIGWVVAMVWSLTERTTREEAEHNGTAGFEVAVARAANKKCPQCAEFIKAEAIKCRFCSADLSAAPPTGASVEARE